MRREPTMADPATILAAVERVRSDRRLLAVVKSADADAECARCHTHPSRKVREDHALDHAGRAARAAHEAGADEATVEHAFRTEYRQHGGRHTSTAAALGRPKSKKAKGRRGPARGERPALRVAKAVAGLYFRTMPADQAAAKVTAAYRNRGGHKLSDAALLAKCRGAGR